jgi:hypothetical protein
MRCLRTEPSVCGKANFLTRRDMFSFKVFFCKHIMVLSYGHTESTTHVHLRGVMHVHEKNSCGCSAPQMRLL